MVFHTYFSIKQVCLVEIWLFLAVWQATPLELTKYFRRQLSIEYCDTGKSLPLSFRAPDVLSFYTQCWKEERDKQHSDLFSHLWGGPDYFFFLYFIAFKSQKRESNVHVTLTKVKLTFKIVILNVLKCSSDKISRWSGEHWIVEHEINTWFSIKPIQMRVFTSTVAGRMETTGHCYILLKGIKWNTS